MNLLQMYIDLDGNMYDWGYLQISLLVFVFNRFENSKLLLD